MFNLFNKLKDKKDRKPSTKPDDKGRIHYQFNCGIKAYQSELTLRQDEQIVQLMLKVEISEFNKMTIEDIINLLVKSKLIHEFLNIILIPVSTDATSCVSAMSCVSEGAYNDLTNTDLDTIFNDFFILNPKVIEWCRTFGNVLTSGLMTQNISDTEPVENQSLKDTPNPAEKI